MMATLLTVLPCFFPFSFLAAAFCDISSSNSRNQFLPLLLQIKSRDAPPAPPPNDACQTLHGTSLVPRPQPRKRGLGLGTRLVSNPGYSTCAFSYQYEIMSSLEQQAFERKARLKALREKRERQQDQKV